MQGFLKIFRLAGISLIFILKVVQGFGVSNVIIDTELKNEFSLKGKLLIFSDKELNKTVYDIKKTGVDQFDVLPDIWFQTGYKKSSEWIMFHIDNRINRPFDLILNTWNSFFYEINFFLFEDTVLISQKFYGAEYTFYNREIAYKNYAFSITTQPDKNYTCLIQVRNHGHPTYCRFSLESPQSFAFSNMKTSFVNGIYYGIILFGFIINFLLFIFSKEKLNLYFSLYALFLAFYQATKDGLAFQYIWPDWPWFNLHIELMLICVAIFFLIVFTRLFIKTPKRALFFDWALVLIALVFIALTIICFIDRWFSFIRILTGLMVFASVITSITAVIYVFRHSMSRVFYFSIFYIPVLLAIVIHLGRNTTLLPINTFTLQAVKLAFIFQIVLLAFELTNRFSRLLAKSVHISANLEGIVSERTRQINAQNEELRTQAEELKSQKEELLAQSEELMNKHEVLSEINLELSKLKVVASKTNNFLYFFDADGNLEWFNESFSSMLGYDYQEYKRRGSKVNIREITYYPGILKILERVKTIRTPVTYESNFKNQEGNNVWYQTTLTPVFDENDQLKSLIAIDTDITNLKTYENELNRQKGEYEIQRNIALMQKESLEFQQKEITDSLRYAKRIQSAILPNQRLILKFWPESFVLLMPRDIVSGDFYWYYRLENKHFIIAVDCTGHGVPGAFMSIIGTYLLNTIIIQNGVSKPSEILKQLNRKIKISLNTENILMQTNDGMDIAICVIDRENNSLEFGSAMRSLYLFNGNEFSELLGDKIPISSDISGNINAHYTDYEVKLQTGATFYMFSDGIIDQFGGKNNKKFLSKRFKQLVTDIQHMPMREQKTIIQATIEDWKGEREQVDDIMVLGIRYM